LDKNTSRPWNFDPLRFSPPAPAPKEARRLSEEERRSLIAKAAYFRAERRHFESGHEEEDWLAAEAEVDQQLAELGRRRDTGV
jgi:hypothetical protein